MKYKKTTLENGLRIITVPLKDSQTAVAMALVEAGSHYEEKNINGLSHFLEHMCFKGTARRSGDQIKYELDSMGAESNAFTGFEYTGYYAKTHFKNLNKALDLVTDIYLNPTFPEKDIQSEKGVIIEEINMYEDLPQANVAEIWTELLHGNQPAGRSILGPKENIKKMKQDHFIKYHKEHYVPAKTVIVVAGNINQAEVLKKVKKDFGDVEKAKVIKKQKVTEVQKTPKVKIQYKKTDQTHLIIGFRAFNIHDKRNPTARIMSTVLGRGFSSRLFSKMRDELGMCYYTRSDIDTLSDHGYFTVAAGVTNSRAEEAVEIIMEEFKKLKNELIDPKELNKSKNFTIGHAATALETSDKIADYYGFQELMHEEIGNPKEKIAKLKAVTSKDIQKLANQIFKKENLNLAIIGPFKDTAKFKKLMKI